MAKRKTIRVNPLDTLVPDALTRQTGKSPSAAYMQSVIPARGTTRAPTSRTQPKARDNQSPSLTTPVAQSPASTDLVTRIQSLEKENEYIKWLVVGAILVAVLI